MQGFRFSDLGSFEKMIAPSLIRILYWVGIVIIAVGVLAQIFGGVGMMGHGFGGSGFGQILMSLVGGVFAVLVWRVTCELWIVLFGIFDRLGEIRDANRG